MLPQKLTGLKMPLSDIHHDGEKHMNNSSNALASTTFYSSKQRQQPNSMNQTGISFNKTVSDKVSSVRVSLQSRRQDKKKSGAIEFKIL